MFTGASFAAGQRAEHAQGKAAGRADLYSGGTLVTAPGGHGTEYGFPIPTISAPEQADAFVAARVCQVKTDARSANADFRRLSRKLI